jgi:hypothetical protein
MLPSCLRSCARIAKHMQVVNNARICRLPERSPEIGAAMRRELIVNACVSIEYTKVHIYSLETFYFI